MRLDKFKGKEIADLMNSIHDGLVIYWRWNCEATCRCKIRLPVPHVKAGCGTVTEIETSHFGGEISSLRFKVESDWYTISIEDVVTIVKGAHISYQGGGLVLHDKART